MFGHKNLAKTTAIVQLAGFVASAVIAISPNLANAQGFGDMLYSPNQGTRSLRAPLIPTAPSSEPGQAPWQGQPPPVGDGMVPAPLIQGDLGGPSAVPSGMSDPTHGNFFPIRGGQQQKGPWNYVPDAGRISTQNGQQQGMYEFGQGQTNGSGMGPGGGSNGTGWINNGGPSMDASAMGPGGKNFGTGIYDQGGPSDDARGMGSGGKNGGRGMGPGGKNNGTGIVNDGGAAGNATGMGPGGKNGGTAVQNNGGAANDARGMSGGGKNGGVGVVNNGGNSGGTGVVNNGGSRDDAQGMQDRLFNHQRQPNRYDFQGPLPTVRTFSRYLVILGVVSATVFVSLAAWSMVMGNQYGGARVMGAVSGLVLLLAAYTIWKIVQMNTFNANSTGWESHYRDGTPMNVPGPGTPVQTNGPFVPPQNPGGGGGAQNPGGGGAQNPGGGGAQNPFGGGGAQNPGGGAQNPGGVQPQIPNPGNPFQPVPGGGGTQQPPQQQPPQQGGGGGFIPILGGGG